MARKNALGPVEVVVFGLRHFRRRRVDCRWFGYRLCRHIDQPERAFVTWLAIGAALNHPIQLDFIHF
jgi:hypothetical protein